MPLPDHKTKILATVGPASATPEIMQALLRAGMNVARLNFSHGDFETHARWIRALRQAATATGLEVTLMADLPGPKIRIGKLAHDPVELESGGEFTLTTVETVGDATHASVSFERLPQVVKPGDTLFLNDGLVQLQVETVQAPRVRCRVIAGGELRSRKGVNLPGIDLGIDAFTPRDRECLQFALEHGVDAVSQSFVESAADIVAVRQAAAALGHAPFVIAKIERSRALDRVDEILGAADAIMIARGDLGVEVPIERIALIQKQLMRKAVRLGKPVITATQMLESMTTSPQPTRAEATDVANAILDGTDCVMLSAESATGKYPVQAVATLARIAAATEPQRSRANLWRQLEALQGRTDFSMHDLLALGVEAVIENARAAAVVAPTRSGATARSITRFRLPMWILAPTVEVTTARQLAFSYGVHPVPIDAGLSDWTAFTREHLRTLDARGDVAVLVRGPSPLAPDVNHGLEIITLDRDSSRAASMPPPAH